MAKITQIIHSLKVNDVELQLNASAYLQHLTFKNEKSKEMIRLNNGIPPLISLMTSSNGACRINAAGVLRNMSFSPNLPMKKQILISGILEIIEAIIENNHQYERRFIEVIMAILCNLSCETSFQSLIVNPIVTIVNQCVLIPFLGLKFDPSSNKVRPYKVSELKIAYCLLLEFVTAFLKNMSGGSSVVRQKLRTCDGLIDCLTVIIHHGFENEKLDSEIVENCVCTIRNLCYGLEDFYNHYNSNRRSTTFDKKESPIYSKKDEMSFENPRQYQMGYLAILYHSEMIDMLLEIVNDCGNHASVEAAIGTIQNLSGSKWHLAEDFRVNFRKRKGLPSLVLHIINGPDRVVKAAIDALKNLADDDRNLELIGVHGIPHMLNILPSTGSLVITRSIPSNSKVLNAKTLEVYLSLNSICSTLSLFRFMMTRNEKLCEDFVAKKGHQKCIFLLRSDAFYKRNMEINCYNAGDASKIPVLAAIILQILWSKSKLRVHFKTQNFTCEDFCVQSFAHQLKANISCSGEESPTTYYGQPYDKARSNTLLPINYQYEIKQKPSVVVSSESSNQSRSELSFGVPNFEESVISSKIQNNSQRPILGQQVGHVNPIYLSNENMDREV